MDETQPGPASSQSVSRRGFLAAGGIGVVGLSMAERAAVLQAQERSGRRSVILIIMNGGPSQLETFDPKPNAPSDIRGPLRAISTAVPGVAFSEAFPRLGLRAGRLAVLRSLCHQAAPIHEAGLQLLQTGQLVHQGQLPPSLGAVATRMLGPRDGMPAHVVLPERVSETGVGSYCGDAAGVLGDEVAPVVVDAGGAASPMTGTGPDETIPLLPEFASQPLAVRDEYGETDFGRMCWHAARLVEAGVRVVTVNTCPRLHGQVTWDAHASGPSSPGTLFDYRNSLGPQLDRAVAALHDDLSATGLFDETLVVCTGEFGRNPRRNATGGRDHWTDCWSGVAFGGGVSGGQVIGRTDDYAESIVDRPLPVEDLVASMYRALRLSPATWNAEEISESLSGEVPVPELIS
ncbi:DUF1501 domain-containing protein [Maioricimonas rarisocia]|uniref:DUF1501 domain-containing protein n=1 Tax=Maioricimonas rarisocia TaxID=2528026 RepID=UPI0018D20594|nr:DUF1501 domain-containing protein [Maioricimonas rarisocia]